MEFVDIILFLIMCIIFLILLYILFAPISNHNIKKNKNIQDINNNKKLNINNKYNNEDTFNFEGTMQIFLVFLFIIFIICTIISIISPSEATIKERNRKNSIFDCKMMLKKTNVGYGKSSVSFSKNGTDDYGYFLVRTPNFFGAREENCVKCYYNGKGSITGEIKVVDMYYCN